MIQTIKFSLEDKKMFLNFPESGMGYHYFEQKEVENESVSMDEKEALVISNSEAIYLSSREQPISIFWTKEFLKKENYDSDLISEIRNAYGGKSTFFKFSSKYDDEKEVSGVKDVELPAPPFTYTTRQGDEFRRLSAFRNDNRVRADGSLRNGSYGTTILDLNLANSGVAAVGRYALPNRLAACYVYQIIPPPGTKVLFGTVTPNFGLCGGGVEVYFPLGCAEGSVRLMGTIPEF